MSKLWSVTVAVVLLVGGMAYAQVGDNFDARAAVDRAQRAMGKRGLDQCAKDYAPGFFDVNAVVDHVNGAKYGCVFIYDTSMVRTGVAWVRADQ